MNFFKGPPVFSGRDGLVWKKMCALLSPEARLGAVTEQAEAAANFLLFFKWALTKIHPFSLSTRYAREGRDNRLCRKTMHPPAAEIFLEKQKIPKFIFLLLIGKDRRTG